MIADQRPLSEIKPVALKEYVDERRRQGRVSVPGTRPTYYWMRAQSFTLARLPRFELARPAREEVRHLFTRGRAALVSYIVAPDDTHPANAWLYVCRDRSYDVEALDDSVRRNIRRAERELRYELLDWQRLRQHGLRAFQETRVRNGLSDGTEAEYVRRLGQFCENRAHHVLGAWKDEELVAFMTLVAVDDWVEIGGFSQTGSLPLRPNNGLVHQVLTHFFRDRGVSVVSYGLSSIQEQSNAPGLHRFKQKIGFEAIPVHRAFIVHPLLFPLANHSTLRLARVALKSAPGSPWLRKGIGALMYMLGAELPQLDREHKSTVTRATSRPWV